MDKKQKKKKILPKMKIQHVIRTKLIPQKENHDKHSNYNYSLQKNTEKEKSISKPHFFKEQTKKEEYRKDSRKISSFFKAFGNRKRFTGSWDEDITSILAMYDRLANMCELSKEEKLRAMPIILDGDALDYSSSKILPQSSRYDQCCRKVKGLSTTHPKKNGEDYSNSGKVFTFQQ